MIEKTRGFVEGWTEPIRLRLWNGRGSAAVYVDPTGTEVVIELRRNDGTLVDTSSAVGLETVDGQVLVVYTPAANHLVVQYSPYTLRVKVTGSNGIAWFPSEQANRLVVRQ